METAPPWWLTELFSPRWLADNKRSTWAVLNVGFGPVPAWMPAAENTPALWIHREVLLLGPSRDVVGVLRFWAPLSLAVLWILIRLQVPRPKLLGTWLERLRNGGSAVVTIVLIDHTVRDEPAPYWIQRAAVSRTLRKVIVARPDRADLIFLTEEVIKS
jgi:hypothetical protein